MEPRVKERLVGAAILVGLIVILVPEMLSGPQESDIGAGDAHGPLQTYTIDLTNPGKPPELRDPEPVKELLLDPEPAAPPKPEPQHDRPPAPGTPA